jgi:hypothetical protein
MIRQSGEGKNQKKEEKQPETGFEKWQLWARAVEDKDIDPADFFDPEEFGYRRRGSNASRP